MLLAGVVLVLQAAGQGIKAALPYNRTAIEQGEWWRLLTGHFVHLGWAHTALNILGIALCCALAPYFFNRNLWLKTATLAAGVGLCLWWASPGISHYVGLSGVLYGLFALGLAPQAWRGDRLAAVALAFTVAWMLWQWSIGPSNTEQAFIGGNIISIAHGYGFALGLAGAIAGLLLAKKTS